MKQQISLLIKKATSSISKKLFTAAIAVTCITASAYASGEESSVKAASSLKKEFQNAENIEWKVTVNYIKASFSWNKQKMEVFYNAEGDNIAVSRFIYENMLPLKAQQSLHAKYADYQLTEAIEFNSEETGTCYYVSLEKDASKKILKISTEGDLSVYKP